MTMIEGEGIILSIGKFSEEDAIITIFSKKYGAISGFFKSYKSKKNISKCAEGNLVNFSWNARLENHLGVINLELIRNFQSLCIQDYCKIVTIGSVCHILKDALPERLVEDRLYDHLLNFLNILIVDEKWKRDYINLELQILAALGFGLDLHCCAVTNTSDDLSYISPKSGRAVSGDAGRAYHELLFKMPKFFIDYNYIPANEELEYSLNITMYFIQKFLLKPRNKKISALRIRLQELFLRY